MILLGLLVGLGCTKPSAATTGDRCAAGGDTAAKCSADAKSIVSCEQGRETTRACPAGQSCMVMDGKAGCM